MKPAAQDHSQRRPQLRQLLQSLSRCSGFSSWFH